jgi:hypothetical protein
MPLGSLVVVMASGVTPAAVIVRLSEADLVCAGLPESVTVKVSAVALAVAVGVPAMAPVEAFRASPAGSVPLVRVQL